MCSDAIITGPDYMKVAFTYNMAEPGGTRDTGKSLLEYMIQKSFVE